MRIGVHLGRVSTCDVMFVVIKSFPAAALLYQRKF